MRLPAHSGVELISASTQAIMNVRRCADIILPILEKRRAVCETFMQTLCENSNMIAKAEQLQEQRRSGPRLARSGASSCVLGRPAHGRPASCESPDRSL
jgi:hypothetical protein